MTALSVIMLTLATARVTLLLTTDAILEPPRAAIEKRMPMRVAYLMRCDWCMSVWVGVVVFLLGWYAPSTAVLIGSGALAASLVTGWLVTISNFLDASLDAASDR
ncbi:hypothetical protein [Ilumatobacter sp.]|uniref:hypothetical protein n=1 Tax=Ilumatobacter sp. TaxID=1967498 RepID=UPI00374FFFAB